MINEQHNVFYEPLTNIEVIILHPTIFKRFLAAIYDGFLILASTFIATALTLPFTKGEVSHENNIYMTIYLLLVIYIFYGWFWTHGGQTLGMRSWKQKLVSQNGGNVNWQQSFIRVITGLPAWLLLIVGLLIWMLPNKIELTNFVANIPGWLLALSGFVWVLLDSRNNNWRDKLSGTHIIVVNNK